VIEFVGPTTEKNKKSKERIDVGDPTEVRLECANLYYLKKSLKFERIVNFTILF